ncbi:MAG: hypothetical protein WA441_05125 [Methyloceanibacter sp.]
MIEAHLHPPIHREGIRYTGRYSVTIGGETVVKGSRDPETDFARALLAKGITGKLTMLDAITGNPRTIIDIEKAAKLRADDTRMRFAQWKPFSTASIASRTAEDDLVLPTIPDEDIAA